MDDIDSHKHVSFSNVSFLVKDFAFNSTFNRVWEFLHFSLRLTRKTEPFRRACAFTLKYSPDLLQVSTIIYYTTRPIHYQTNNGRMNERTIDRPNKQTTNRRQKPLPRIITGFYTGKMCNTNTVTQINTVKRSKHSEADTEREKIHFSFHYWKQNKIWAQLQFTLCNSKLL